MIKHLHPKNIVRWDKNPRGKITAKSLTPLVDSMRAVGWFGSILVRPHPEGMADVYQVIAGERRLRAAQSLGLESIACEVRELTDREAIEYCVVENRDRQELDVIEEARAYQTMMDLGWEVDEIATRSGRSKRSIQEFLGMSHLPADIQAALREGRVTKHVAIKLKLVADPEARERILGIIAPEGEEPMTERAALPIVAAEVDENRRREIWEGVKKRLGREKPEVEVLPMDAMTYHLSRVDEKPATWELCPAAREHMDTVPTWGEMAAKHGAPIYAVADDECVPVMMVERALLVDAERAACQKRPQDCIFPMGARNDARHAQSHAAEHDREAEKADWRARMEAEARLHERLRLAMIGPAADRWPAGERSQRLEDLADLISGEVIDFLDTYEDGVSGIDFETLGDGDAREGMAEWWRARVLEHGPMALAWLGSAMLARYVSAEQLEKFLGVEGPR